MKTPYNKQLTPGNQLFVGLTYKRHSVIAQHIALWQRITSVSSDKYLVMKVQQEFHESNDILFFTEKGALEEFETWWTHYSARFPKDQVYSSNVPQPQEGEKMSGYPLMHKNQNTGNLRISEVQRQYVDQWHWLAQHTSDQVLFTKDFWLFENEAEMIMFKLRDKRIGDEDDEDTTEDDFDF